jgi:hypothetical protein
MKPTRYLLLLLTLLLGSLPALAQTTWTGATSTDWATASNWSTQTVPTASDDVVIPSGPTNQPTLSSAGAVAKTVEVQSGTTLTIASTGTLTINGKKNITGDPDLTTGFLSNGTVNNSGQLALGTTASVGTYGIYNLSTFNNKPGGTIAIDRSGAYGLNHQSGTFTNEGMLTIGAKAKVGNTGIGNVSTFNNKPGGRIAIDNSSLYGLANLSGGTLSGTFTNEGTLTLGATASVGSHGIYNESTFHNKPGGRIATDNSSSRGLWHTGGTFTNEGTLTIGAKASVGDYGIYNASTFNNKPGGKITIDNSNQFGLYLYNYSGAFTNEGTLTIGAKASVGSYGIYNGTTFSNSGCTALVNLVADAIIYNPGISFTNSGQIVENASGTSSISSNSGIVVNNKGGTFNVGSGPNQPLSVVSTNATQCAPSNGSIQLTGLKANQPYTLRYGLSGGSTTLLTDSISTASGTLTIPGLGAGIYSLTLSGSCVPLPIVLSATLTSPPPTQIQSLTPSQGTCPGVPFTLTVGATGQNLTYQWYRVTSSGNQPVAGATSASLTLAAPASGSYFVVVSGACGPSVTSQTVTLSPLPPTILQVSSLVSSVCEGGSLTLSVRGSGPAPLAYAWRKDDPNGTIIGNGSSLTIQNAQPTDAGTYYCTLTSACQSQTVSIPVTVRYVRITTQPQSVNLCSGQTTLTVGVQAVGVTPTYQWKRNGTNIAGATQASYVVQANRPGTYSVEVKTACGILTSQNATVGCANGRLALESVEAPSLVVLPNPVRGGEIRVRVLGMENPEFSLSTSTGRSVGLIPKADGDTYVLVPGQALTAGVYVLRATEGTLRLSQRVLVTE